MMWLNRKVRKAKLEHQFADLALSLAIRFRGLENVLDKILQQNEILFNRQEILMAAIDNLTANLATLKTDVDALIANQSQASEAQIQAAADAVAALDAEVVAATAKPAPTPAP